MLTPARIAVGLLLIPPTVAVVAVVWTVAERAMPLAVRAAERVGAIVEQIGRLVDPAENI